MWLTKQKKGVRYVERAFDGKKFGVTFPEDTKQNRKEAALILIEMIDEYERSFDLTRLTLSELFERYILDSTATDRSIRNYDNAFKHIIKLIGNIEANELRPVMVKDSFKDLPTSKSNRFVMLLKMVLNWAYKMDYIEKDIAPKLSVQVKPESKKKDISQKYLEPDEVEKVLDYMKRYPEEYYLCNLMLLTGMRIGEAVAIKHDDISKEYIRVDETYDPDVKEFTDPKNETSNREIFIQEELRDLLKDIRRTEKIRRFGLGISDCDLLLCNSLGEPILISTVNSHLHKAEDLVHKNLTSHIFRHTHISMLAASGLSLDAISRRVGHKNPNITRNIYLHVTSKQKEQDNAAIKKIRLL